MDPRFHGPGPGFNPGQLRRTPASQSLVALRHQVTIAGSQQPPGAPGGAPQFSMGGPALYAPPGYMAPGSSGPPAHPSRMIPVNQPGTPYAAPPRFMGRPVAGPFYPPVAAPMMVSAAPVPGSVVPPEVLAALQQYVAAGVGMQLMHAVVQSILFTAPPPYITQAVQDVAPHGAVAGLIRSAARCTPLGAQFPYLLQVNAEMLGGPPLPRTEPERIAAATLRAESPPVPPERMPATGPDTVGTSAMWAPYRDHPIIQAHAAALMSTCGGMGLGVTATGAPCQNPPAPGKANCRYHTSTGPPRVDTVTGADQQMPHSVASTIGSFHGDTAADSIQSPPPSVHYSQLSSPTSSLPDVCTPEHAANDSVVYWQSGTGPCGVGRIIRSADDWYEVATPKGGSTRVLCTAITGNGKIVDSGTDGHRRDWYHILSLDGTVTRVYVTDGDIQAMTPLIDMASFPQDASGATAYASTPSGPYGDPVANYFRQQNADMEDRHRREIAGLRAQLGMLSGSAEVTHPSTPAPIPPAPLTQDKPVLPTTMAFQPNHVVTKSSTQLLAEAKVQQPFDVASAPSKRIVLNKGSHSHNIDTDVGTTENAVFDFLGGIGDTGAALGLGPEPATTNVAAHAQWRATLARAYGPHGDENNMLRYAYSMGRAKQVLVEMLKGQAKKLYSANTHWDYYEIIAQLRKANKTTTSAKRITALQKQLINWVHKVGTPPMEVDRQIQALQDQLIAIHPDYQIDETIIIDRIRDPHTGMACERMYDSIFSSVTVHEVTKTPLTMEQVFACLIGVHDEVEKPSLLRFGSAEMQDCSICGSSHPKGEKGCFYNPQHPRYKPKSLPSTDAQKLAKVTAWRKKNAATVARGDKAHAERNNQQPSAVASSDITKMVDASNRLAAVLEIGAAAAESTDTNDGADADADAAVTKKSVARPSTRLGATTFGTALMFGMLALAAGAMGTTSGVTGGQQPAVSLAGPLGPDSSAAAMAHGTTEHPSYWDDPCLDMHGAWTSKTFMSPSLFTFPVPKMDYGTTAYMSDSGSSMKCFVPTGTPLRDYRDQSTTVALGDKGATMLTTGVGSFEFYRWDEHGRRHASSVPAVAAPVPCIVMSPYWETHDQHEEWNGGSMHLDGEPCLTTATDITFRGQYHHRLPWFPIEPANLTDHERSDLALADADNVPCFRDNPTFMAVHRDSDTDDGSGSPKTQRRRLQRRRQRFDNRRKGQHFSPNASVSMSRLVHQKHIAWGHPSYAVTIAQMDRLGLPVTAADRHAVCDDCEQWDTTRVPRRRVLPPVDRPKATQFGEVTHCDIVHMPTASKGGYRYFLLCIDEAEHIGWAKPLKSKDKAYEAWVEYANTQLNGRQPTDMICLQGPTNVGPPRHRLHSDADSVFRSAKFQRFNAGVGIRQSFSRPYAKNDSPLIERYVRTIRGRAKTMLKASGLGDEFWVPAVAHSVQLTNMLPTKACKGLAPHEHYLGADGAAEIAYIFSRLQPFGTRVWVRDNQSAMQKVPGRFIGYSPDTLCPRILKDSGSIVETSNVTYILETPHGHPYDPRHPQAHVEYPDPASGSLLPEPDMVTYSHGSPSDDQGTGGEADDTDDDSDTTPSSEFADLDVTLTCIDGTACIATAEPRNDDPDHTIMVCYGTRLPPEFPVHGPCQRDAAGNAVRAPTAAEVLADPLGDYHPHTAPSGMDASFTDPDGHVTTVYNDTQCSDTRDGVHPSAFENPDPVDGHATLYIWPGPDDTESNPLDRSAPTDDAAANAEIMADNSPFVLRALFGMTPAVSTGPVPARRKQRRTVKGPNGTMITIPLSMREARNGPDWDSVWHDACYGPKGEFTGLRQRGVCKFYPAGTADADAIRVNVNVVFDVKHDLVTGEFLRGKVRAVADGRIQRPGLHFEATSSPVMRTPTTRAVIALAAGNGWKRRTLDIAQAFLWSDVDKVIFARLPPDFLTDTEQRLDALLVRSLYGLCQASWLWHIHLKKYLRSIGYIPTRRDPCLFYKWVPKPDSGACPTPTRAASDNCELGDIGDYDHSAQTANTGPTPTFSTHDISLVGVHVDDCLATASDDAITLQLFASLDAKFKTTTDPDGQSHLGMRILDHPDGSVTVDQERFLTEVLQRFDFGTPPEDGPRTTVPMKAKTKLAKPLAETAAEPRNVTARLFPYRRFVASFIYGLMTRPDISYCVAKLCQHMAAWDHTHVSAASELGKYVRDNIGRCLRYGPAVPRDGHELNQLYAFSDATIGDTPDGKPSIGWVIYLNGSIIAAKSTVTRTVCIGTPSSEFIAASECCRDLVVLREILAEIGFNQSVFGPSPLYCDCDPAKAIANNEIPPPLSRFIHLRYLYLREQVHDAKTIEVRERATAEMDADVTTKPLDRGLFWKFTSRFFGERAQ